MNTFRKIGALSLALVAASGALVNNEKSGYSEIAIFKSGVTL